MFFLSECQVIIFHSPGYFGAPPDCRPECVINSECAPSLACINLKCANPCVGVCGINARCDVVAHNPICSCPDGYVGDPFSSCRQRPGEYSLTLLPTKRYENVTNSNLTLTPRIPLTNSNPPPADLETCDPSSCGPGAIATVQGGECSCSCPPGLEGDPRHGCRPECVLNSDCAKTEACSSSRCVDPCPGTCGRSASCSVINHIPTCVCLPGHTGNAFEECVESKHG